MKFYFICIGDDLFELKKLKSVACAKGSLFENELPSKVCSTHASIQLRLG
jgi:hypothetical protein